MQEYKHEELIATQTGQTAQELESLSKGVSVKYALYRDVVSVQGHGAILLLQFGSTVLCVGDNGKKNSGASLEIRLFAPLSEKWAVIKWN